MKITLNELRSLISQLVAEYVSSLPPKEKVINPNAKKIGVLDPRSSSLSSRRLPRVSPTKSDTELSDEEIDDKLDLYGVDKRNVLDMLASDRNLRRDLGLGSDAKRNSDYYKRIYAAAAKKL
jgi:hypothetical protein